MEDLIGRVARLNRPCLLNEAARFALPHYNRSRDLARLLGNVPQRGAALVQLLEIEAAHDAARRGKSTRYRASGHVMALTALLAEYDSLRARLADPVT